MKKIPKTLIIYLIFLGYNLNESNAQQVITINNVQIAYINTGSKTDFFLSSSLAKGIKPDNSWLAIGFNSDNKMSGASVVVCQNLMGKFSVETYYNNNYSPELLDKSKPNLGISDAKLSVENGSFNCMFTRDNSNPKQNYFDLNNNSAYILSAFGTGNLKYHGSNKGSSENKMKISIFIPTSTSSSLTTTTTKSTATITTSPKSSTNQVTTTIASSSKSSTNQVTTTSASISTKKSTTINDSTTIQIVSNYNNAYQTERFSLYWNDRNDSTDFYFVASFNNTNNIWSAFGLSNDQLMGDDDVAVCKLSQGVSSVEHYFNNYKNPILISSSNPIIGFSNVKTSFINGALGCSFTRAKRMQGYQSYLDLNKPYYLLSAFGSIINGSIYYHGSDRQMSQNKIDFVLGSYKISTIATTVESSTTSVASSTTSQSKSTTATPQPKINSFLEELRKFLIELLINLKEKLKI